MRYKDIAELLKIEYYTNENGCSEQVGALSRQVFVNVKSVSRTEFYKSLQAGIKLSIAFDIRLCDYEDENIILYNGKQYKIERTYTKDGEMLELNCSDIGV